MIATDPFPASQITYLPLTMLRLSMVQTMGSKPRKNTCLLKRISSESCGNAVLFAPLHIRLR
jgi:hypothetical protein